MTEKKERFSTMFFMSKLMVAYIIGVGTYLFLYPDNVEPAVKAAEFILPLAFWVAGCGIMDALFALGDFLGQRWKK